MWTAVSLWGNMLVIYIITNALRPPPGKESFTLGQKAKIGGAPSKYYVVTVNLFVYLLSI